MSWVLPGQHALYPILEQEDHSDSVANQSCNSAAWIMIPTLH